MEFSVRWSGFKRLPMEIVARVVCGFSRTTRMLLSLEGHVAKEPLKQLCFQLHYNVVRKNGK